MLIEEKPLKHWIENFYGYGSWEAKIWFIGYEESGGDVPEEVADKINYFYKAHPSINDATLCDVRAMYSKVAFKVDGPKAGVFKNLYEYRFDTNAIQNSTWKNLIAFSHAYRNQNAPDPLVYQRDSFASRTKNNEALLRLYPLPAHNHAWYYSWLELPDLTFLKSRALYEEHVYDDRIKKILSSIDRYKPELVLMYGMENINLLKQSVQEFFHGVKFKMVKAIKQEMPQHHRADFKGTTLLITTQIPALRHNRIETGYNWEEFGKSLR
jgi:hypothetical protein